jgi:hypothetical protein
MRSSIYISNTSRSIIGKKDWWPLEVLIGGASRAIDVTKKYGRAFERPPDLSPIFHIRGLKDVECSHEHGKAIVALIGRESRVIMDILEMPGILSRNPGYDTFDVVLDATERIKTYGSRARQIVGACLKSVHCAPEVAQSIPGIEFVAVAWNRVLFKYAEDYEREVEAIPDKLSAILASAREGRFDDLNITFNLKLDTQLVLDALDVMQHLREQGDLPAGPRAGKIYALINSSMPGLVKIGKTTRDAELRADELNTTGVPTPFIVLYELDVVDCDVAEREVHKRLSKFRVADNREFFRVQAKVAVDVMVQLNAGPHSQPTE